MNTILSIRSVVGEPGRLFVQSRTLFCADTNGCKFSYQNKGDKLPKWSAGDACPKCGKKLEPTDYLVDLTLYSGLGRCACHRWAFHLQPLVAKMSPAELQMIRESSEYVCAHIQAARIFFAMQQIDNLNRFNRRDRGRHNAGDRQHEGE